MKSEELMLGLNLPAEKSNFSVEVPFIFASSKSFLGFIERNQKSLWTDANNLQVLINVSLPTILDNHSDLHELTKVKPFCGLDSNFLCVNTKDFSRNYPNQSDELFDIWNKEQVYFLELPDAKFEETHVVVMNQLERNGQFYFFGPPFALNLNKTSTYLEIRNQILIAFNKALNKKFVLNDPSIERFCSLLFWNELETRLQHEETLRLFSFKPLLENSYYQISNNKIFSKLIVRWNDAHIKETGLNTNFDLLLALNKLGKMENRIKILDHNINTISLIDCFNFWRRERSECYVCNRCEIQIKNHIGMIF